jgi:hypothetical protein
VIKPNLSLHSQHLIQYFSYHKRLDYKKRENFKKKRMYDFIEMCTNVTSERQSGKVKAKGEEQARLH